jgi:hypothetical protein
MIRFRITLALTALLLATCSPAQATTARHSVRYDV